ncbi:hypothetical protein KDL01_15505 [Actinospica durhamensis]|uniref:ABC3 transporter permease C-terminal domain-containing protein n=1 Tax=Actinospica durhamensis TaxID=1508375 RepID=A0A941ELL8_9ACTN|nr:FtsX-like permease family protein [Actinospica durhamensis]MBR7834680.1 hypothetical protein [Actinospica durhamensis]
MFALVLAITAATATLVAAFATFDAQALRHASAARLANADTSFTVTAATTSASAYQSAYAAVRADARQNLGGLSVETEAGLWSKPLLYTAVPTSTGVVESFMVATATEDLSAHAALTAGSWPQAGETDGAVPMALPVALATKLKLGVGGQLRLGVSAYASSSSQSTTFTVVGLYQPDSTADRYWQLSPVGTATSVEYGAAFTYGPLAVSSAAFTGGALTAANTVIQLDIPAAALAAADPSTASDEVSGFLSVVSQDPMLPGVQTRSTLPDLLATIAASQAAAGSTLLVSMLELALLAVTALTVCSRPLVARREAERALFVQRGRSTRQFVLADLAEAVVLSAMALVIAGPLGLVAGRSLSGHSLSRHTGAAAGSALGGSAPATRAWEAAAIFAAFCIPALFFSGGRRRATRELRLRSTRQARLVSFARAQIDVVFLILFGVAYWQLRSLPLISTGSDGGAQVNPLGALCPALGLCAAAMLGPRLIGLVGALADRLSDYGRSFSFAQVAWQVGRTPRRQAGPASLLVLAVALGTFSFAQHETWRTSVADQSAYEVGADVHVTVQNADPRNEGDPGVASLPGVQSATAAMRSGGDGNATYLALDSAAASRTLHAPDGTFSDSSARVWSELAGSNVPAITLPGRPALVTLVLRLHGELGGTSVVVSVQDAHGVTTQLPARTITSGSGGSGGSATLAYPVPTKSGLAYPLRLVGIRLQYNLPQDAANVGLSIVSIGASDSAAESASETAAVSGVNLSALATWSGYADSSSLDALIPSFQSHGLHTPTSASAAGGLTSSAGGGWTENFQSGGTGPDLAKVDQGQSVQPLSGVLTLSPLSHTAVLPAAATTSYLSANHLQVGTTTTLDIDGNEVSARILASTADFPTMPGSADASGGLILDLARLQDEILAGGGDPETVDEWWLTTRSGAVPTGLPAGTTVADLGDVSSAMTDDLFAAPAQQALLALGIAVSILAVIALASVVAASRRERTGQEAVLAALGVSARRQAALQCGERLVVNVPAALLGLCFGVGLAYLLLPSLTLTTDATIPVPAAKIVIVWGWSAVLAVVAACAPLPAVLPAALRRPDPAARLRMMEEL